MSNALNHPTHWRPLALVTGNPDHPAPGATRVLGRCYCGAEVSEEWIGCRTCGVMLGNASDEPDV